jgi:hypothetical protein
METSSSVGSLAAATDLLQSQGSGMVRKGPGPKPPTDDAKIDRSAQQFEAILVGTRRSSRLRACRVAIQTVTREANR